MIKDTIGVGREGSTRRGEINGGSPVSFIGIMAQKRLKTTAFECMGTYHTSKETAFIVFSP